MIPSFKHGIIASSRPRVVAGGGGGFTVGEFNFTNISTVNNQTLSTNTVTMSHSGTLAIDCTGLDGGWGGGGYIYKNGVLQNAYTSTNLISTGLFTYNAQYASVAVSNGDQIYFTYSAGNDPPYQEFIVTIRNATFAGTVIDQHYVIKDSGCFLTTAVVAHMGGLDSGPELTAMRLLREHYKNISAYDQIIREYYQNSPAIISAINSLADSSIEYDYIYNTVISVMNHVNAEEWQQAHDLYMAMYNDLKKRYLG